MAKATSISAANLAKFTQAAVRAATKDVPGKVVSRGPIMGYILAQELVAGNPIELATEIAKGVAANARAAGLSAVKPKPVVVQRPGNITVGFIAQEIGIAIRG
jgi:hypothetical protein